MPFTIPNVVDVSYVDQAELDKVDLSILTSGIYGDGVVSGGTVTAQGTALAVDVTAGTAVISGTVVTWGATALTIPTAGTADPRFDLVVASGGGSATLANGTAAANAVFPYVSANSVALASVYTPANGTVVTSGLVTDKRVTLNLRLPSLTLNGAQPSTAKNLHITGDIAVEYGDQATFVERPGSGIILHRNSSSVPTAITPYLYLIVQGKGDNATPIGVSGMYVQARDRTDVDSSNKGVLYGAQFVVVPAVARNNVPNDDIACLVLKNDASGVYKGTDAIYIGRNTNFTAGAPEWISGLLVDCNADYAFRAAMTYINGLRLDEATFTGSAIKVGNTHKIASENQAGNADVNLIWLDTANMVNIADGGEGVYMGANAATGENPELRIYGYRTGVGVKYGVHWIDTSGNYNIQAASGQLLGLVGPAGVFLNWGSQADVSLFAGSSGSTTNRSLLIAGWDGAAAKTGTLKISTTGIFQMIAPTAGINIGTATSEKVAAHGASPTVQRASAAQALVATTAATQTTPWGYSTQAQADAIVTLVNEVRDALVEKGWIKGAA